MKVDSENWTARLASPFLYASGIYRRRWRRISDSTPCCVVVNYHRITSTDVDDKTCLFGVESGLPVTHFESHLRFLLRNFEPISVSNLVSALTHDPGSLPHLSFSVTFDDGYEENLTVAAPVLKRLGIPAAFYLATDFVGTDRRFWWEQLTVLLRETPRRTLPVADAFPELLSHNMPATFALNRPQQRDRAHHELANALKHKSAEEIENLLSRLSQVLDTPLKTKERDFALLDWDGVRMLCDMGFEIGAHTATHANLGRSSDRIVENEVRRSVDEVQKRIGQRVLTFSYPYGRREHRNTTAMRAVAESGCLAAFTTEQGVVCHDCNHWALPRVSLHRPWRVACAYRLNRAFDRIGAKD